MNESIESLVTTFSFNFAMFIPMTFGNLINDLTNPENVLVHTSDYSAQLNPKERS